MDTDDVCCCSNVSKFVGENEVGDKEVGDKDVGGGVALVGGGVAFVGGGV